MGQPENTLTPESAQANKSNSQPSGCVVVCGCGFGGRPERGSVGEKCPLGMPWLCLRQLALPFAEPADRRKQTTAAGGTPSL